ncbi:hypothetical protein [Kosakonia sacchari]|uniref:hypothetical protein n=1 Tax=Kosakonia sacchari TaxID=1158459 RepID=UPI0028A95AC8|nr:hypothetical protein [Kosakonia sacchari]
MPVKPNDFLDLAIDYASSSDEIQLRNAVSRAYYAGYLHVLEKVNAAGIRLVGTPSGMHEKLISTFNSNGCAKLNGGMTPPQQYEVAGLLKLTKQLRARADYSLTLTITQDDKDTAISNALELMKLVP